MAVNGRIKGHAYERATVAQFKTLGFPDAVTSRYESKSMDDQKVDLCNTYPFHVQCKAVEKLPKSYHAILDEMPDHGVNILLHKKNRQGTVVALKESDFYRIVKVLVENNLLGAV
jgi:hypothetical protein